MVARAREGDHSIGQRRRRAVGAVDCQGQEFARVLLRVRIECRLVFTPPGAGADAIPWPDRARVDPAPELGGGLRAATGVLFKTREHHGFELGWNRDASRRQRRGKRGREQRSSVGRSAVFRPQAGDSTSTSHRVALDTQRRHRGLPAPRVARLTGCPSPDGCVRDGNGPRTHAPLVGATLHRRE
jgi:hypothetical protein